MVNEHKFQELPPEASKVRLGEVYQHYKGGLYRPQGFIWLSANGTDEWGVMYIALMGSSIDTGGKLCARPLSEWCDSVAIPHKTEPGCVIMKPRFSLLEH